MPSVAIAADDAAVVGKLSTPTVSGARGEAGGQLDGIRKSMPYTSGPAERQTVPERPGAMPATVVGRTGVGQVVLNVEDRLMRVEDPVDLPIGTTLQMMLVTAAPASSGPISTAAIEETSTLLVKLIDLLDAIDRQSRRADDGDQPPSARQLPAADKHLASRFLGLLSAIGGRPQSPEPPTSFEPGRPGAVQGNQIHSLVRDLGSRMSEPLADGWKAVPLPIDLDSAQAVSLFYRDLDLDPDEDSSDHGERQETSKRAVFEVTLSRLGRCQLDAFCQERRFDLMIRVEHPLSVKDRQDIAALFDAACEIAGMNGQVGFKVGGFFEPARSATSGRAFTT